MKVLMIVTSHSKLGSTDKATGFWLEELAVPYQTFTRAGVEVDIASPQGGKPPADPASVKADNADVKAFIADARAVNKLDHTLRLADVRADYDAVFVAGGHGVMWDLVDNPTLSALLSRTYADGKVVAAVCHGPAALVGAKKADGKPLVAGHRVAGFSNEEEQAAGLSEVVPFLLESKLSSLGGRYERGPTWKAFAVRDGQLVTGQNPASSQRVAEETLVAIRER